jgi:two-component system sensor histidine kinase KdpD
MPDLISEHLVRWTHQHAGSLNCPWIAVYVQTSAKLSQPDQLRLVHTLSLARELGAEVITSKDENVVRGLLRTAAGRDITQIIVGKPVAPRLLRWFRGESMLRRLIEESGEIGIHVVQVTGHSSAKVPFLSRIRRVPIMEYLLAAGVVAATTGVGVLLDHPLGYRAIAWLFLSAVMALAFFVGRGPILMAATLSALTWDYFFEEPLYSFTISRREDQELFVLYFVVALVLGQLTSRIRRQEKAETERAERAKSLYFLTRELAEAADRADLLRKAVQHVNGAFGVRMAVLLPDTAGRLSRHPASSFELTDEELRAVARTVERSRGTDGGAEKLPQTNALCIVLSAYGDLEGVAAFRFDRFPISLHQRNFLDQQAQQIALALHRHRMREVSERAKLLAESERLSKTLLDAMSHEIRTPLAVIQAAASNLVQFGRANLPDPQLNMIAEIQEAADRLNRLIGKILQMTRLESGCVKPKLAWEEVGDLLRVAQHQSRNELRGHNVAVDVTPGLPLVRMDFDLMLHSLVNLLSNAGLHTPDNTDIRLTARVDGGALLLIVADSGPGIPPGSLGSLFDKFYRAPKSRPGGAGLGLSLVKGFVEAQGGEVTAANRAGGGAVFTIRLPLPKDAPGGASVGRGSETCAC